MRGEENTILTIFMEVSNDSCVKVKAMNGFIVVE